MREIRCDLEAGPGFLLTSELAIESAASRVDVDERILDAWMFDMISDTTRVLQ